MFLVLTVPFYLLLLNASKNKGKNGIVFLILEEFRKL